MSVTLTEEERKVVLELVQSINPRDIIGVLLYTGMFRKLSGDKAVVNLANKLEGRYPPDHRCSGCGCPVVNEGDECHSCRDNTHNPEDKPWLSKYRK